MNFNNEIYTKLYKAVCNGTFVVDRSARVIEWDSQFDSFIKKMGVDSSKPLNMSLLLEDEMEQINLLAIEKCISNRVEVHQTLQVCDSFENKYTIDVLYAYISSEGGTVVGSLRHVTQNQHDALYRDAVFSGSDTGKLVSFLGGLSHEFRTPMNGIIGMTGLLLGGTLDETQKDYVRTVRSSATSLLDVVNDIADLTTLEEGSIVLDEVDFDIIDDIVEDVDRYANENINAQKISYHTHVENLKDFSVYGDVKRLRESIINIIKHFVLFTSEGNILLRYDKIEQNDNEIVLEVCLTNTGLNIDQNKLDVFFDSFSNINHGQLKGSSLNLFVTKRILEKMGGSLSVTKVADGGISFWLKVTLQKQNSNRISDLENKKINLIPMQQERSTKSKYSKNRSDIELTRQAVILLVEDNVVNQKVAMAILEKLGYEIHLATNGKEAIRMLGSRHYDLVLMDIVMPVLSGFEATKIIRENKEKVYNPHVPIIAMTAHARQSDRSEYLLAGMNDCLFKPVSISGMKTILEKWIDYSTLKIDNVEEDDGTPMVNKEYLLEQLMGDSETLNTLLLSFVEDTTRNLTGIKKAALDNEISKIKVAAQLLGCTFEDVASPKMKLTATQIEQAARGGNIELINKLIEKLEAQFELAKD